MTTPSRILCFIALCALMAGCSPLVNMTIEPRRPAALIARRAPPRTTCRVLLNLERGKLADVRIEPELKVTLGHGTVLRHGKHTYEVWKRQNDTKSTSWQNIMARKLPKGRPFVLEDNGNDAWGTASVEETIWIQATFGAYLSFYLYQSYWESGMSRASYLCGYAMVGLKGTAATDKLLSKEALRGARRIWRTFLSQKDTSPWVKGNGNDPMLFSRRMFSFNLTLRYPGRPTQYWGRPYANMRFAPDELVPSRSHVPGLFLQSFLPLGYRAYNHGFFPFAIRMTTVPPALKHHTPKPGTTRVVAPDACASVDLQTNEIVSPSGRRRKLPGVTKIIGVTWIPGEDPFNVRQLQAAEIEAAPSLRRARQYEKKKQHRRAAEHYLHGARLLSVGSRYSAAAKVFQRALRLPFKRKRLRVKIHSELGWALFSAGRLDKADRVLRAGLALKPRLRLKGTILFNLGRVAEKRGKLRLAKSLYRSSVMVRFNATALNRLRWVMRILRRKRKKPRVSGGSRK